MLNSATIRNRGLMWQKTESMIRMTGNQETNYSQLATEVELSAGETISAAIWYSGAGTFTVGGYPTKITMRLIRQ